MEAAVRRAAHAYLDFALTGPDLYQVMYGLVACSCPRPTRGMKGRLSVTSRLACSLAGSELLAMTIRHASRPAGGCPAAPRTPLPRRSYTFLPTCARPTGPNSATP